MTVPAQEKGVNSGDRLAQVLITSGTRKSSGNENRKLYLSDRKDLNARI